jgi:hypothetical protein
MMTEQSQADGSCLEMLEALMVLMVMTFNFSDSQLKSSVYPSPGRTICRQHHICPVWADEVTSVTQGWSEAPVTGVFLINTMKKTGSSSFTEQVEDNLSNSAWA